MNSHLGRTTRILIGVVLALVAAGYTATSPEPDQSALERAASAIGNPLLSVWALLPVWLVMCLLRARIVGKPEFLIRFGSRFKHWWWVTGQAIASAGIGVLSIAFVALVLGLVISGGVLLPPPGGAVGFHFIASMLGLFLSAVAVASVVIALRIIGLPQRILGIIATAFWLGALALSQSPLARVAFIGITGADSAALLAWVVTLLIAALPAVVLGLGRWRGFTRRAAKLFGAYLALVAVLAVLSASSTPASTEEILLGIYGTPAGSILAGMQLALIFVGAAVIDDMSTPRPRGGWSTLARFRRGSMGRAASYRIRQIVWRASCLAVTITLVGCAVGLSVDGPAAFAKAPSPTAIGILTVAAALEFGLVLMAVALARHQGPLFSVIVIIGAIVSLQLDWGIAAVVRALEVEDHVRAAGQTAILLALFLLVAGGWRIIAGCRKAAITVTNDNDHFVVLSSIGKQFRGTWLYRDVNIDIEPGRIYGLAGPNGSGKSVLLRIMCGLAGADTGVVSVRDDLKPSGRLSYPMGFGVMIDGPGYLPGLTGLQNLEELARIRKLVSTSEIERLLLRLGLPADERKKVSTYSAGMKQKLGIAQAVMEQPRVLVLDEPFNALDEPSTKIVRDLMMEFKAAGASVVLTSHVLGELEGTADVVFDIVDGTVRVR